MAAGTDFLLSALGIPKDQIDALKTFLEPDNLKTIFGELKTRFDAMEARNIEMHAMVRALAGRGDNSFHEGGLTRSAVMGFADDGLSQRHALPGDEVLHAEMDRQTVLFETQARTLEHG